MKFKQAQGNIDSFVSVLGHKCQEKASVKQQGLGDSGGTDLGGPELHCPRCTLKAAPMN